MTVSDAVAEVFRRLEELQTNPAFWQADEVLLSLNDGWEELALHTEWYRTEFSFPLQDGVTYYDLRDWAVDEIITPRGIWNETLHRWLEPETVINMDRNTTPRWETISAAASKYVFRGCFTFGVFGRPTVGDNSDFVTILATAVPQPLGVLDYTFPFPEEFVQALILYAIYDLKCQEGEVTIGLGFWKQYFALAEKMKEWAKDSINHAITRRLREASC